MSSLNERAHREAYDLVTTGINSVADRVEREAMRRESTPAIWLVYHTRMADMLPRWRVFARVMHRRRARHFAALVSASAQANRALGLAGLG